MKKFRNAGESTVVFQLPGERSEYTARPGDEFELADENVDAVLAQAPDLVAVEDEPATQAAPVVPVKPVVIPPDPVAPFLNPLPAPPVAAPSVE